MSYNPAHSIVRLSLWTILASSSGVSFAGSLHELPLYDRLGGKATVTAVVDDVIDEAVVDIHTRRSFANTDVDRIKRLLVEQICALTGGGCIYSGDSMREVHAGLGITQAEFYDLVQVLRDALIRHRVALRERNELLRILAPMKRDIVEK